MKWSPCKLYRGTPLSKIVVVVIGRKKGKKERKKDTEEIESEKERRREREREMERDVQSCQMS